jgi:hypothetical protein
LTSARTLWSRLERERSSVLVVLFGGILAFLVVPVATRNLPSDEASTFLVAWSALNVISLAVFAPVELMAPAIVRRSGVPESTTQPAILLINRFYVLAGLSTAVITPLIVGVLTQKWDVDLLVASALYMAGYAVFSLFRSRCFGLDQISRAAFQLGLALLMWLPLASALVLSGNVTPAGLVISVAFSYALATLLLTNRAARSLGQTAEFKKRHAPIPGTRQFASQYGHVASSVVATLTMQSIGVLLATMIGTQPAVIVTYAAILILARAVFAGLAALNTPFAVRYADYRTAGRSTHYMRLFLIHTAVLILITLISCILAASLGPTFLEFYTDQPSAIAPGLLALICLGEGLITLSIVPRAILVNESHTRIMSFIFPLGTVVSVAVMLIPMEPTLRLALAPLAGGVFVCATLFPVALLRLKQHLQ